MYGPGATFPTVNVNPSNTPLAVNVHEFELPITAAKVGLEIPYGGEEQEVIVLASADANPLPETVTTVPIGPETGVREMVGWPCWPWTLVRRAVSAETDRAIAKTSKVST